MSTSTILLCGVGGQGTILATDLLALAAMSAGYEVKISEIHGMSQRGGAVTTVLRFGDHVDSMVADPGCADYVISFETTEALRNLPYLAMDGALVVNDETIKPMAALTGRAAMPSNVRQKLTDLGATIVPASNLAKKVGNPMTANVVLLGALSSLLEIEPDIWMQAIRQRVPERFIDINIKAFEAGREFAAEQYRQCPPCSAAAE